MVKKRWGGLADKERPVRAAVVGDIWNIAYLFGTGKHLVFTNYDIIVRKDFYVKNLQHLRENPRVAVVDNLRRDLVIAARGSIAHWTVEDLFRWEKTHDHPGHDCFLLPRSWIPCIQFADFVFGIGNWGTTTMRQLK